MAFGIRVDGASLFLEGTPGMVYVHSMLIGSSPQDPPMDIQVGAFGMGQGPEGDFLPLPIDQDTSPYSARAYISSISVTSFRLAPGAVQPVEVTVSLPMNLDSASHYAVLQINCLPVDPGGGAAVSASVLTRYLVPVVITPRSASFVRTAAIEAASMQGLDIDQAVDVMVRIRNTGNRHFRVRGYISFTGPGGGRVGEMELPRSFNSVIPGQARVYRQVFRTGTTLARGRYLAHLSAFRDDGALLAERQVEFWIGPQPTATSDSGERRPTATQAGLATLPIATGAPVISATPTMTLTPLAVLAPTSTATVAALIATATPPAGVPHPEPPGLEWAWLFMILLILMLMLWTWRGRIWRPKREARHRG